MVTAADVVGFVQAYAEAIHDHRAELVKLDAAIGDADHGENMDRGLREAVKRLPDGEDATPADVLKAVAMALISKVGGAAGPLYGTAFLRAATAVDGRKELDAAAVVDALAAALEGVKARGKADAGDKTMIDAWAPAVDAARRVLDEGGDLRAVLGAAADAARAGKEATTPMLARKGRASYLGERSIGHPDPGATSTALLFETLRCEDG